MLLGSIGMSLRETVPLNTVRVLGVDQQGCATAEANHGAQLVAPAFGERMGSTNRSPHNTRR
jgi:hypothetical protein